MKSWNSYQALVFCLPLAFGGYANWVWPLYSAVALLLLATEVNRLVQRQVNQQLGVLLWPKALKKSLPILLLLLAVQLWVIGQSLMLANGQHHIWQRALQGLGLTAFMAASLLILNSRERIKRIIWVVILAASFQAIYGSLMVLTGLEWGFFQEKEAYQGKATGTFVNRNHLAGYLEMSLALGIGFLLSQSNRYYGSWRQRMRQAIDTLLSPKVAMRLLLAVMVIALVLSRSRMGNTAFFASLMVTGGLALLLMNNKSRSTTILLSSLLVIDIAIVGTFFGVEKVAERLQNTTASKESRDEVSRDTFQMWQQNPVFGIGAGAFEYTYPAYRGDDVHTRKLYDHAHNDYLQFLAEYGLVGFMALLIAAGWSFFWAIEAMRKRRSELFKGLGFASTMGMMAIAIHSTVDFNLQIPANAFMFVLLMALASLARWAPNK